MRQGLSTAPLPSVREEPDEIAWEQRIEDLLREANRVASEQNTTIVLKGGTAGKLGYGLTRPSRDIDIDVVGDVDAWEILKDAGHRTGLTMMAEPERQRPMKGRLVVNDATIGTTVIEVDVRKMHDPGKIEAITRGAKTERRHGICMYSAAELARQKIEMVTKPGGRRRGRDRYDIAWWLLNRVDVVPQELRIALDEAIRTDRMLKSEWDQNHTLDRILRRVSKEAVHDALRTALDTDPAVLKHRWPDGTLHVRVHPVEGATVEWQRTPDETTTTRVAELENDSALEDFMVQMELWKHEEVPARTHALQWERQNANKEAQEQAQNRRGKNAERWSEATVACTKAGYFIQGHPMDTAATATKGPVKGTEEVLAALREHGLLEQESTAQSTATTLGKLRKRAERTGGGRVVVIDDEGRVHTESRKSALAKRMLRMLTKITLSNEEDGSVGAPGAAQANTAIEKAEQARNEAQARAQIAATNKRAKPNV